MGRCIVAVDPRYFRPTEVETLLGNPAKAKAKLGWVPKTSFDEMVTEMVTADYELAKRDALVRGRDTRYSITMSNYMQKDAKIFVAGHRGLAGSAIVRKLGSLGYENLLLRTRQEVDLQDSNAVSRLFAEQRPEFVFLAAAKVGGILANRDFPADFIAQNLRIQSNVIESAYRTQVKRLLFLGSSCIYPKLAPQPIPKVNCLAGPLEFTNRSYAVAKIAGIELCWAFNRQHGTGSWPRCRPTFTAWETTTIWKVRTFFPH